MDKRVEREGKRKNEKSVSACEKMGWEAIHASTDRISVKMSEGILKQERRPENEIFFGIVAVIATTVAKKSMVYACSNELLVKRGQRMWPTCSKKLLSGRGQLRSKANM